MPLLSLILYKQRQRAPYAGFMWRLPRPPGHASTSVHPSASEVQLAERACLAPDCKGGRAPPGWLRTCASLWPSATPVTSVTGVQALMHTVQEEMQLLQKAVYARTLLDSEPNIYTHMLTSQGSVPVMSQLVLGVSAASGPATGAPSHSSGQGDGGGEEAGEGVDAAPGATYVLDERLTGTAAPLSYLHPPGSQVRAAARVLPVA